MDKFLIKTNDGLPFYKKKLFWIISSSAIIIIIIIIIIVATVGSKEEQEEFVPYMCYDNNKKPSKNCLGGWFYKTTKYTPEYNAKFAQSKNWNFVLISLNEKSIRSVTENVNEFRKRDISVHIMILQDTKYLNDTQLAYDETVEILNIINNNSLDVQGIHIDVEPHATYEWKSGDPELKKKVFQKYTEILEICRQAINKYRPKTTFSAAVGWFYSARTRKNEIAGGRGYELANKDRLDFLVPMIYDGGEDALKNIMSHSKDYINDNSNLIIGLSVVKLGDNNINSMIEQVIENRKNASCFYGIAVFSNHYYNNWGDEI